MRITPERQNPPRKRALAILPLIVGSLLFFLLVACDKTEPSSTVTTDPSSTPAPDVAAPIKARLAKAFLQGTEYDGLRIDADHFDPITQILEGVRVTTQLSLLSAARAEIRVNYAEQTAQLVLYDVVTAGAPAASDPDAIEANPDLEGVVYNYERLELDPFSIEN